MLFRSEGRVDLRVMDGRSMPFEDAQFDAVFSFGVLHHIPVGWRQAVAEVARVLEPGGWFVFTDLILTPRAGRWLTRLLPRVDLLDETALHTSLGRSSLSLVHGAYGRGERLAVLDLMNYYTAVARKPPGNGQEPSGQRHQPTHLTYPPLCL